MVSKTRLFVVSGLAVTAVILSVLIVRRLDPSPMSVSDRLFEETRTLVADLRMRDLSSADDVVSALEQVSFNNAALATREQIEALRQTIGAHVDMYHVNEDAKSYLDWRLETTQPNPDMVDPNGIDRQMLLHVLSIHASGEYTQEQAETGYEELFEVSWKTRRQIGGGANVATALSAESKGIQAQLFHAQPTMTHWPGMLEGPMKAAFEGGSAISARRWTVEDRPRQTFASTGRAVLAAQVSIVFEFADGTRRPVHFHCYWDDIDMRWRIESVSQSNVPDDHLTWPWEL